MKKSTSIMLGALLMLGAISCERNSTIDNSTSSVRQAATSGNWRVSHFSERGNDETSDFNGYSFQFNADGSLVATRAGVAVNGTWSTFTNDGKPRMGIQLDPKTDANKPLGELTDDWVILSNTATEIRLTDDNAASQEFLNFSKN